MNNKKTLIILALVLVAVIAGAAVLYDSLGDTVAAEQLATQATEETEAPVMQAPDGDARLSGEVSGAWR